MTCFGINNEGQLVLDYYHEDTDQLEGANIYNGQNSVLWCNFRDAFPDEIEEMYRDLRSNGILNYDELVEQFITKGSDKWSESVYNEDGDFKYISMLRSDGDASNLGQVRGTGEEHLRYFLGNRINYCDGKWYAADYADDYIALRIYTPVDENSIPRTDLAVAANADITVTPYSHMYAGVRYKANGTLYQKRVSANEVTTFEAPNETFNDTETAIYGASQLSSLGDLSPLYCGSINVSKATKLTELIIGNNTDGYSNPNLNDLSVGTNNLLKVLNVRNCPKLTDPLALTGCPNIEEIYAGGSGITGVELTDAGYLKVLELPATVTNLTLKNQIYIESLTLEGYDAIKTLWFENCPTVNSLDILDKATNVERVRLTNVNWSYDNASLLYELIDRKLAGIDENGTNTDTMWVDGKCHIKSITGDEYAYIKESYPYLTITYDELTSQLIFMSEDGETELTRRTIYDGGDGTCPVKSGELETPTKESTAQYHFTFGGWSLTPGGDPNDSALLKIEADRYVYVAFSKELRSYNVNFYNGSTLLQTVVTKYGSDAVYTGNTPIHDTYPYLFEFTGWKPEPTNITGELNTYAQYYDPRVITDDWTTIAANCENGSYAEKYQIGAYKPVEINYEDGTSETIDFEIIAHDHDELLDDAKRWVNLGSNFKGMYVPHIYKGALYAHDHNGTLYKFNVSTNSMIFAITLPTNTKGRVGVYNDGLYCVNVVDNVYTTYKYNDANSTWDDVNATYPDGFALQTQLVEYDGKLYAQGGYGNRNLYVFDGSAWSVACSADYTMHNVYTICVYNGKLHMLMNNDNPSNTRRHFVWDGVELVQLNLAPSGNVRTSLIVYRGKLNIIGELGWYIYNSENDTWHDTGNVSPYSIITNTYSPYIEYRGRLYRLGSQNNTAIQCFEERGWVDLLGGGTNSGISGYGYAPLVIDDQVYIFSQNYLSKFDLTTIPYTRTFCSTTPYVRNFATVYNGEIYAISYKDVTTRHNALLKYDAGSNTFIDVVTLPDDFYHYNSGIIAYNGKIYIFDGNTGFYTWDGSVFSEKYKTLPVSYSSGTMIVYNNELHVPCFKNNSNTHYKFDGESWSIVCTTPYSFYKTGVTVYNNELYVFGGNKNPTACYKFNGTEWVDSGIILPRNVSTSTYGNNNAFVYRNRMYLIMQNANGPHTPHRLENPKAPLTFLAKNLLKDDRAFHSVSSNHNTYWSMSDLRAWCNGEFYDSLPEDLQASISEVIKLTDNGRISKSLEDVKDKCWILSFAEVGLEGINMVHGQGDAYSVFTNNKSRIRSKIDSGDGSLYWSRTAATNGTNKFVIQNNGTGSTKSQVNAIGVLPGFCIGGNGGASDV